MPLTQWHNTPVMQHPTNSHGIDLVLQEYSGLGTGMNNAN